MRCLIQLETNDDPISACRLMNIFRRKGLKIETLLMAPTGAGYSLLGLVEFPESESAHLFSFLRRTEGVLSVSCYRPDNSAEASFILVQAEDSTYSVAEVLKAFPGSRLVFASLGTYLLQAHAGRAASSLPSADGEPQILRFVPAMISEPAPYRRPLPAQVS